jgi:NTE family protein
MTLRGAGNGGEAMTTWLRRLAAAASAMATLLGTPVVFSADDANRPSGVHATRPKICLVLSGGGARGAAHIGVIKVLEELRVPVDCIAGTSMGALVGAAYATGTSVPDMEKLTGEISTELLFKEEPPRQDQSMRRKQDDYSVFVTPEIGVAEGKLGLPKGVVSGVQLETVLRKLARTKGYLRFDELPIPFRAVATDLVTGKEVVFSQGDLASVMRASMSVPGAVAPAEVGGMMLVDGMLTKNLPIEVARAMGADIIIAVNVGTPLLKREQLDGILAVTGQMLSILTEQNVQASLAKLKPSDILITPALEEFTTADFDHLPKIVPHGETAAREVAERLTRLSVSPAEYAEAQRRRQVEVVADQRPVDEIRFEHLNYVNPETVRAIMETQAGQPIDQPTLDRDMRRIYGTGDFEHVQYSLLEEPGRRILVVDAVEKSWGQQTIRLGLGLSFAGIGDQYFNLLARYRRAWINSYGGEWRAELQAGRTSALRTEFYQPLSPAQQFFVAPSLGVERRVTNLYLGNQQVASYETRDASLAVDVGALLGRYGEVRLGLRSGVIRPRLDIGPPSLSPGEPRIDEGAVAFRLALDQLDSVNFPRSGWYGTANLYQSTRRLGADQDYLRWDAGAGAAMSFGEHTLHVAAKLGGHAGPDPLPRYDLFQWGGFLRQSGYATGQFLGESLSYARVMYYRRILRGSLFEGAYGGLSLEVGKIGHPLVPGSLEGWLKSAMLFAAIDTPLGPTYLGYGYAADGSSSLYLYVGTPY